MALATSQDVVDRLGRPLSTDETARVTGLLDEASVMVEGWMRCVPDPVPDAVKIVVSRMVARVLAVGGADNAPEPGVSQLQATMGIFGVNRSYSSDATSGGVWLTKQDKATLRPFGCRGRVGNVGTSKW
ncbi:hypothetical protein BN970_07148 [Mycolicibacterium conceptionense]|uniref:Head-to-tail adaptor n=1 Tax=Mycolicibacterium conceptionense TaxID=451644 RepID=A0A0U1E1L6_9MYCO|nr:hypothetical protein [Mycolicibacterium conceptionense]ORV20051.1 hypothetical protein AWB98_29345 [Mycolicibacterium conceptionense]CQD15729.1 hypothetical protein BN970_03308 [Mycolicibacterium conceptionense]CQD25346.1 hypothetical protein BN970_07148 [Mycolicibacterium conceptionense]